MYSSRRRAITCFQQCSNGDVEDGKNNESEIKRQELIYNSKKLLEKEGSVQKESEYSETKGNRIVAGKREHNNIKQSNSSLEPYFVSYKIIFINCAIKS